jgi:putative oxidoreductase
MNQLRALEAPATLLGRLLLALIFLVDGWELLSNYSGSQGYMEAHGVPGQLLPLAILTEVVGALLVAVGLLSRLAALALAGFCVLTALLFHTNFADVEHLEMVHFMKDLAIAGGFLTLTAHGPGAWSLDARWRGRGATDR